MHDLEDGERALVGGDAGLRGELETECKALITARYKAERRATRA